MDKKFLAIGAAVVGAIILWKVQKKEPEEAPVEYICPYCGEVFDSPEALDLHIEQEHPEPLPFVCEHCGARFATMAELTEHVETVHGFFCSVCGENFATRAERDQHLINVHGYPAPGQAEILGVEYLGVEWGWLLTDEPCEPGESMVVDWPWAAPSEVFCTPSFKWRVTWKCAKPGDYTIRLQAAKKVYGSGADWHYITGTLTTGGADVSVAVGEYITEITTTGVGPGWDLEGNTWPGTFMVDVGIYITGQPAPIHSFRPYPALNAWGCPEVELP